MAVPLTLGISANGMFVVAMALIPNLSSVLEALMPVALFAYGAAGLFALVTMTPYLRRIIMSGFNMEANNGLNHLLAAFAFAMVAVRFAAPAALGATTWVIATSILGALSFSAITVILLLVFTATGALAILRHGLAPVNSATLWLTIPATTLLAIMVLRIRHGLQTLNPEAENPLSSVYIVTFLGGVIMLPLAYFGIGNAVMRRNGFYRDYVTTRNNQSPVAFTLVCPGVGFAVLSMFFINVGLVNNGIVDKFSAVYYVLLIVPALAAGITVWLMATLYKNQLRSSDAAKNNEKAVSIAEGKEAVAA